MTRMSPPMASIDDRINEWKRQWEKRVRADFAVPVKVCNASQRETYKPEPAYCRNDGHKHLKSRGVL